MPLAYFSDSTMRFLAACSAMRGLLSDGEVAGGAKLVAKAAVEHADALLAELGQKSRSAAEPEEES